MVLKYACALVMAGLVAMPATAQDKPAQKADKVAAKNDPNRQICRPIVATGSRLGSRRECHTQAEWEQMRTDSSEMVRRSTSGSPR